MNKKEKKMSRKEFLKTSSAALLGLKLSSFGSKNVEAKTTANKAPALNELGRTGIKVSPIGFGASRTMEPALVMAALDAGFNFLDTGRSYFNGQNEVMVGKVVKDIRKDVVIQSKFGVDVREQEGGLASADEVKKVTADMSSSLEACLKALGTDYIDIMLIHGATSPELIHHEAVMGFFEAEKKKGKIRAHGFSTHTNQIELIRAANLKRFYDVIMVTYNHKGSYIHMNSGRYSEWDQGSLEVEMDKAYKSGIGLVAMKTCSAGPYAPDNEAKPSFEHALRWILDRHKVHTMAVAMGNFDQIEENRRALL
jgi:aryl-alcohol dehydrogenase-like predicted oxidoreductase